VASSAIRNLLVMKSLQVWGLNGNSPGATRCSRGKRELARCWSASDPKILWGCARRRGPEVRRAQAV